MLTICEEKVEDKFVENKLKLISLMDNLFWTFVIIMRQIHLVSNSRRNTNKFKNSVEPDHSFYPHQKKSCTSEVFKCGNGYTNYLKALLWPLVKFRKIYLW
ncbi:hypothetical protein Bhyg_13609 [Pseudolycoriella hygida]|uniref:Uncharacterized protein n=1 Tax=Pseudolycoriella hygida TaxID=35572 RepID=A0A9Q0MNF1_9DIPT|nr:hypothetical protein Bhyg_13609 [Pseudolycoriella hygida]